MILKKTHWIVLAALAALLVFACDPETTPPECDGDGPDNGCDPGFYCAADNTCHQDCTTNQQCEQINGAYWICTENGECVFDDPATDADTDTDTDTDTDSDTDTDTDTDTDSDTDADGGPVDAGTDAGTDAGK